MSSSPDSTSGNVREVLGSLRHPLDAFFSPRSVAVIGASEKGGSVGRAICSNLLNGGFAGSVFPINPKRNEILGVKAFPAIAAVPGRVDLAVVATPASTVPGVIEECGKAGVRAAIVISAGFKEAGAAGAELERQVLEQAREYHIRIIGPNCLGVMNPAAGLNATFAAAMARPGNVAFLSQSGALCTAILDWSMRELVGFSAFISTGSMMDVGWGDLIDYLGDDPRTHSILIYMESIGDARSFLSAAREVALNKPIIVIKAGRTDAAAKAAASHTGALTGSDDVLEAAFRRTGVLRVNNMADLFYMAEVLARQPLPRGPRLTIVTNAGGPAVLATDALIGNGGQLAVLPEPTLDELDPHLPGPWSHANPIDILGDADPQRYVRAIEVASKNPDSDGMLVIVTPQDMTEPTQTAQAIVRDLKPTGKPILASFMGGPAMAEAEEVLNRAGIPTFPYPDTAARAFDYMWRYSYNLRGIYETPAMPREERDVDAAAARRIIEEAGKSGRTLLDEAESKRLLGAYGIPVVQTEVASTPDTAVRAADAMGYPVAVKLYSKTITHKSDVGGVKLNLQDSAAVRRAYQQIEESVLAKAGPGHFQGVTVQQMLRVSEGFELIVGSSIDPQFGPVMLFGAGGEFVEIFKDRALALPPLNPTLAKRMMEHTKIYAALGGARGRQPIDMAALEQVLVRFSRLVVEQRRIKEIDINPLLASSKRLVALDARVVLFPADTPENKLPKLAIRPYPTQYVKPWTMNDGTQVLIRPIRPEDEPLLVEFHRTLSEQTVQYRYFSTIKLSQRVTHPRLIRVCFNDYDRELALVVETPHPETKQPMLLAVGRLSKEPHTATAEFAIMVSDRWQGKGIGAKLLSRLVQIGRDEKLEQISADILSVNSQMQSVARRLGFSIASTLDPGVVRATIVL
jgi:acetyltransferase